ncbi:actin-like ATPase domain-containing protein [Gigaspora margarita]|uniref:Actin-like ATPase domain-containing protein n=1 Tax=Gigaspora margarita TaxID=4874 RepID=A0A8H3WZT7_GIGMA|nr:actin-like ATPase domain-containing protein [Gigaspora margarita]
MVIHFQKWLFLVKNFIDFGTTYSGFAYAYIQENKEKIEIVVNEEWGNFKSPNKTNTALQYDETYRAVVNWGASALSSEPTRRKRYKLPKPVEYFKFYLGDDVPEEKKTKLPQEVPFEKAITDFLHEMGKIMKERIENSWPGIDFCKHVLFVFSVPAEFNEIIKTKMRKCIYDAGLIRSLGTLNLQFTTEPEAASVYCINKIKELKMEAGVTYLVVDCGGGTVDLTVRKLLNDDRIAETTERTGGFCGGTYIDDEFLKFLEKKAGKSAVKIFKEKHYDQVNYMVHKFFCPEIKIPFSGKENDFKIIEFDIEKKCPALIQYINDPERDQLENDEWIIDLDFATVKSFFDPVIEKIIKLITLQLSNCSDCSLMFLVGGFSQSKYLQHRIKEEFVDKVKISIPPNPAAAILRGACLYGIDMKTVATRVLKWSYGVLVSEVWQAGDPISRKDSNGRIDKFSLLASKGTEVDVEKEFSAEVSPVFPNQTSILVQFYYTSEHNSTYCDEPHVRSLGSFIVSGLPIVNSGLDRRVLLTLRFASMESTVATAKSLHNGDVYHTAFSTLSDNGHLFPYRNQTVAAFHIIFVLDRSGSMNSHDQQPTSGTPFCNNRLGAAFEATDKFIKTRINSTQGQNTNIDDIYSIILFESSTEILFENQIITDIDFVQDKLKGKVTKGGTNFRKAVREVDRVIDKHFNSFRLNVIIFLSDGQDRLPENELTNICQKNKEKGSPLYFNTIHFGSTGGDVLRQMANIAQNYHDTSSNSTQCQYTRTPDTISLINSFTNVANSLLLYKSV